MSRTPPKIHAEIIEAIHKSIKATGKKPKEIHVTHKGYQQLLSFMESGGHLVSPDYPLDSILIMGVPVLVPLIARKNIVVDYDVSYGPASTYVIEMRLLDGSKEMVKIDRQSIYGETAKDFLIKRGYYFAKDS